MDASRLLIDPPPPEWRRSSPFLLLALALHGAVLLWPLRGVGEEPAPPQVAVTVSLRDAVTAPEPVSVRPAPPEPVRRPPVPQRTERPQPKARPVLAMAASAQTAPAAFSVPAPVPEPPAAAASAPVAAGPVQAPAPVTAARYDAAYLHNPEPKYPPISRRLGEQGKVLLKVRVTAEGLPAAVDLERSSSFERLDEAARQVVGRWRFVPAKRGEQAIEASVIVPIVFRLEG